jgi:hypothetical protein
MAMSFDRMVGQGVFIVVSRRGWVAYTYVTHDRAKKTRPAGDSTP